MHYTRLSSCTSADLLSPTPKSPLNLLLSAEASASVASSWDSVPLFQHCLWYHGSEVGASGSSHQSQTQVKTLLFNMLWLPRQ